MGPGTVTSPLEAMFPNRCFDCLVVCSHDEVLCENCKAVYRRGREGGDGD